MKRHQASVSSSSSSPSHSYPFLSTGAQVWRKLTSRSSASPSTSVTGPLTVTKLPETFDAAKTQLAAVSNQQALATRYLRNSIALSYASGGVAVFHLGGLPGAGKTTIVKELITELKDSSLIDANGDDILLCSKSNSAKNNLMSACRKNEKGELLYPQDSFATLNSGFSIPVVHDANEVTRDRVKNSAGWLSKRVFENGLGNVQFLAIDEYTMSSCREIVYVDAVLRMIKLRPDIPFGGVFVLFLGDNRQNSAVVGDSNNRMQRSGEGGRGCTEEGSYEEDGAKLYTDLFNKILKDFSSRIFWGNPAKLRKAIDCRLDILKEKKRQASLSNDQIIKAKEKKRTSRESEESKHELSARRDVTVRSDMDAAVSVDCTDCTDDDSDDLFSEETFSKILEGAKGVNSNRFSSPADSFSESFSSRCKRIAEANVSLKNPRGTLEPGSLGILKGAPLSALVEEGLLSEIRHLETLARMGNRDLENHARDIFCHVVKTASKAMEEIDYTGREKLYVISSLSQRFSDVHVTSLMDEEILNAKLMNGSDEKCCDLFFPGKEETRWSVISACIRNAFFRDGVEVRGRVPIAEYFYDNLEDLVAWVSRDGVCYKDMLEMSETIAKKLTADPKIQRVKVNKDNVAGYFSSSSDSYDTFEDKDDERYSAEDYSWEEDGADDDEETAREISRKDAPREINSSSTTKERVDVLVSFHVTWRRLLSTAKNPLSGVVRSRIWHLYALVRMQQAAKTLAGGIPSLDRAASTGRLFFPTRIFCEGKEEEDFQEEYWLRALSMPISSRGDEHRSLLLPAYSSYLSAYSRTFIMSSLKRINAVKHAYALMYGLSLFDMTVDVAELVDSRKVFSIDTPIGYERDFDVREYLETIFPSMIEEYFKQNLDDVLAEARTLKGSCTDTLIKFLGDLQVAGGKDGRGKFVQYSNKSMVLALRMLISILKGNERSKLFKERENQCSSGGDGPGSALKKMKISLEERFSRDRMMGAITLTRSHSQKNAVSHLVDSSIINVLKNGANSIKAIRSDTQFCIKDAGLYVDLSYLSPANPVRMNHMKQILENIRKKRKFGKPFIDYATDARLQNASQNYKSFTRVLTDLRNKVAQGKTVSLYQGQNVVFTNTNAKQIHGTSKRFVTKDTGVVTDIAMKGGAITVSVLVERLGKEPLQLKEGIHYLGSDGLRNNPRNAYVKYIPLESSQAMTIYSCQGQTFSSDTIVDLTGTSARDAYVAVTRNDDPLNLYIVQAHRTERETLANLKHSMGRDRASLLPLGSVGKLGGDDFVNYDAINVSREILGSVVSIEREEDADCHTGLYSAFDPTRDMVTAAQRFVMNRSGNALAFNTSWMARTAEILKNDGTVDAELGRINEFFFGKDGRRTAEYAEYYSRLAQDKIMELFTAVSRSVTHYAMAAGLVKRPSLKNMRDHLDNHKNKRSYVKIHPCFLNPPPMKESISSLFFDVAPHTKAAAVLQFYVHYLFLVNEKLHICNSSFAFLPSSSPVFNYYTRPVFSFPRNSDGINDNNKFCAIHVPGGGMGYESESFARSADGGLRNGDLRIPVTSADDVGDKIDVIRNSALASESCYDEEKADKCTECVGHIMRLNLRRAGKFCRPKETCGLTKHGAVVVATDSESVEDSHIHQNDRGWISMSNEANMYGLLVFMTNMAAATGVSVAKIEEENLEPRIGLDCPYRLRFSDEVLWTGQAYPMERIQFVLHASVNSRSLRKGDGDGNGGQCKIFGPFFEKDVLRCQKVESAKVLVLTEMMGHTFAEHSTSKIRGSIFHGPGKVIDKRNIENEKSTACALRSIEIFVLERLSGCKPNERISFFVSCKYRRKVEQLEARKCSG